MSIKLIAFYPKSKKYSNKTLHNKDLSRTYETNQLLTSYFLKVAYLEQLVVDQGVETLVASAPQEGGAAWSLPGAASFAHEGASLASVG